MVAAEADRQAEKAPYVREPGAVGWWNITPEKDTAAMEAAGMPPLYRLVYFVERQALGPNRSHQLSRAAIAARAGVSLETVRRARRWIKRLGLLDHKRGGRGKPTRVLDPHPRLLDGPSQTPSNALKGSHRPHLLGSPSRGLRKNGPHLRRDQPEHQPPRPFDPDAELTEAELVYRETGAVPR